MKAYEISVLIIEPDQIKEKSIERILEYVGLSGRDVRDTVESEHEGLSYIRRKKYDLIIGSPTFSTQLCQEQIHVVVPEILDATGYIQFLSSLTKQLEEKFGFNYDD